MRILSLCDYTGNMLKPWRDAGHQCVAVDIAYEQDGMVDGIYRLRRDVRTYQPDGEYDWIFAFPPCTDLASSGARWWSAKGLEATIEALQLVNACRRICETATKGSMLENPVGRLSSAWRKPDHMFDPCDYGDPYTKKTCLWIAGEFKMPIKTPVPATLGSKMHKMGRSKNRARKRSETPMGFAQAVHATNDLSGDLGGRTSFVEEVEHE